MKLSEHVELIRQIIDKAFRNRLGRMGITATTLQPVNSIPVEYREYRKRIENIREVFIAETGSIADAYEKLIEEFTFTFFNRLAAIKVMEAHTLNPEIITRRSQYGDRSFAHILWLEQNPNGRYEEQEGLVRFIEDQFSAFATDIALFDLHNPYHLLPTAIELNGIINAFNQVETDAQVEQEIWKSDDVLGWLYESYNNYKKTAHKESGAKTEFNKVSIQSQVYTPRWVVKFLVDNSLGKLYLEMYPDSVIKEKYKIANAPKMQTRDRKPLIEIRLIDPATGSGNFLLYAFDLFYDLYIDQINNYGAGYKEREIPELIIRHNLHGVDLDDRAVQLAQLGLYIKTKRRNRTVRIENFNIVSSDFFLPAYDEVKHLFENDEKLIPKYEKIVSEIWKDLQLAYKFGSLIRLEEKFTIKMREFEEQFKRPQMTLFEEYDLKSYNNFRISFFRSLQKVLIHNKEKQGVSFLNNKTCDAIAFMQLLTQKYDVAITNPPYTDSSDFGPELKKFVDENYKQPYKFNANLYATFIMRCYELIDDKGKIALIHPLTFMYIKSFEDVRKFIIDKMHINIVIDYGLSNHLFEGVAVNPAFYIFEKEAKNTQSSFIKLNDLYEGRRYENFVRAYDSLLVGHNNEYYYTIYQSELKIIESWPFIYWISDGFREKFKEKTINEIFNPVQGAATTDNNRFLRFWWEVDKNTISKEYTDDLKRWIYYAKGGPFKKWYGNLWLLLDWGQKGQNLLDAGAVLRNSNFYFQEGITYTASGSKGASYRYLPSNCIFDTGGSCIFLNKHFKNINYLIAFLNSSLLAYIVDCLNPTVNTQVGDLQRVPIVIPDKKHEEFISLLATKNIEISRHLCSYKVFESNFNKNPLTVFLEASLRDRILAYLNYENAQLALVLINETIINQLIFEVYKLCSEDRQQVENKIGKSVGELPVLTEAKEAYLLATPIENPKVMEFILNLTDSIYEEQKIQALKEEFTLLHQSNMDLEEFCISHQLNPINVWYWFRESKILPQRRAAEIALEVIVDACHTILMEDEDGIIPLVGLPGEVCLYDRVEQYCINIGFSHAQFIQLDGLLGRPINEYMEHYFFDDFCNLLNLYRHLPKTPFIWHLSSGIYQGFEAFVIIYKWNRDSLYKLKTQCLSKRVESLKYREIQLSNSNTAQAQNEKEIIRLQLQEIAEFTKKIEELISGGYDPMLDDGVGKNIAPLQNKGLLHCEVLNEKQLMKYLKADW